MAHYRLGQKQLAEKYLNEAIDWIGLYGSDLQKGQFPGGDAFTMSIRRYELRQLCEEAAKLIGGATLSAGIALRLAEKAHAAKPDDAIVCNELAWRLVAAPPAERDPPRALALAEKAVTLGPPARYPNVWAYHNTLGVALYRVGRYKDAIVELQISIRHQKKQYNAFDLYFLAMCHQRLGDKAKANESYEQAVGSHEQNETTLRSDDQAELRVFRAEAEELLKGDAPPPSQ
jgi:tetratricopeptide (TPR) repeat protein